MACWDTTVILDLLGRNGSRKRTDALEKLKQLEHDQPHSITRFTIAEVLVGVEMVADRAQAIAKLQVAIDKLEVLEFDELSMRTYAKIFRQLQAINRLSGVMDMLIAAVALRNRQRIVTRNPRHFALVPGLRVDAY